MQPLNPMQPTIISSKAAEKDLARIRGEYDHVMKNMNQQAMRVNQYKMQQNNERRSLNQEFRKEQIENQRYSRDADMKLKELELKKLSLSQTPQ